MHHWLKGDGRPYMDMPHSVASVHLRNNAATVCSLTVQSLDERGGRC